MTRSPISLALKIAQLIEEYSDREIRDAVGLLQQFGQGEELLRFLSGRRRTAAPSSPSHSAPLKVKSLDEITSRAVLKLKDSDPEKFKILSEFDLMVRRGQLLPAHEDLRRFGERVSKNFEPRKARKETISAVMTILADRPVLEIERLIEFAASFGVEGSTDEYQRLARFLIEGKGRE